MIDSDRKDLLWISIVSILILLWSSVPTWAGYQAETRALRFRGLYYDSQDYAAHIAMMEAGVHGAWTYQFRFTTEPLSPAYVRIFYVVLGHLSRSFGLTPESTYNLARWLLGFIALLALYKLTQKIFADEFWARVAFLLAALGSGLGWLQLIFNWTSSQITPIDFWFIDGYVFFSLSVFPHFAFVTAAMCLALSHWLDYLESPNAKHVIWIILAAILIQFTNPIAFAAIDSGFLGATLFAWWNKRRIYVTHFIALSIIAIAQIPVLAYNLIVLGQDPLWREYTSQHQTLSPSPDYYLWGFGLFWPFAIWGTIYALREKSSHLGAAIFWIFAAFSLAYAPLYTQQRFLQNITIPLATLATYGLMALSEASIAQRIWPTRWRKSVIILFVLLASLSSIQLSLGRALYLQTYPEGFYYPVGLNGAIKWFRENAQYNDFVLASEQTSQVLAQKAGLRAYFGHEMETIDYKTKQHEVQAFFQGNLPELVNKPIKWVVYGPFEKELSPSFQAAKNLKLVYNSQGVQIYQVK